MINDLVIINLKRGGSCVAHDISYRFWRPVQVPRRLPVEPWRSATVPAETPTPVPSHLAPTNAATCSRFEGTKKTWPMLFTNNAVTINNTNIYQTFSSMSQTYPKQDTDQSIPLCWTPRHAPLCIATTPRWAPRFLYRRWHARSWYPPERAGGRPPIPAFASGERGKQWKTVEIVVKIDGMVD